MGRGRRNQVHLKMEVIGTLAWKVRACDDREMRLF